MLLTNARLVPLGPRGAGEPVSVRVRDGLVAGLGVLSPEPGEEVVDAGGRWLIPGLWDAHVHLGQWARRRTRLDVSGTGSPREVAARVAPAMATAPEGTGLVVGAGYRPAAWPEPPTVAVLDEVSGNVPVVLVSGDAHAGWLNSAALARFGLAPRSEPLVEAEWFEALPAILAAEDSAVGPGAYAEAMREAASRGIVGLVDYEFEAGFDAWPRRSAAVGVPLRVRTSTYPRDLDAVIADGIRSGDVLAGDPDAPLVTMGSLKVITDGSLNTRTAACVEPYPGGGHGVQNVPPAELRRLVDRASRAGLTVALHAIGDAAVGAALDAFTPRDDAPPRLAGTIEHAQLMPHAAAGRMAALGLVASVQPAHLLDDREVLGVLWGPERAARSYAFRTLRAAGVPLALGSDAPVAPLDPWLAMAAAVFRGEPGEEPWHPEQALSAREALAASTGGHPGVAVGSPADIVLLDADPLAGPDPARAAGSLRGMPVAATWVAGRLVHSRL